MSLLNAHKFFCLDVGLEIGFMIAQGIDVMVELKSAIALIWLKRSFVITSWFLYGSYQKHIHI